MTTIPVTLQLVSQQARLYSADEDSTLESGLLIVSESYDSDIQESRKLVGAKKAKDSTFVIEPSIANRLIEPSSKTSVFLGVTKLNRVVALIEFCYPRTPPLQSKYSTELAAIYCEPGEKGALSSILQSYIENFDPSDISLQEPLFLQYANSLQIFCQQTVDRESADSQTVELLKIYEWLNLNQTHYTYRITAEDSDKYYYGVSHLKTPRATKEDCADDGYFGSGSRTKTNKFFNWKNKHKSELKKEVLETFSRKSEAYAHEKLLVGDLWRTDPLCLNSAPGGKDGWINRNTGNQIKDCAIHGLTVHRGEKCYRCIAANSTSVKECPIHGESKFRGDSCQKCTNNRTIRQAECPIHGLTTHKGKSCSQCSVDNSKSVKECAIHGEALHTGDTCATCTAMKGYSEDFCELHGATRFKAGKCLKCAQLLVDKLKECPTHGLTLHRGSACISCSNSKSINFRTCATHGYTKHQKNKCSTCIVQKGQHTQRHKEEKLSSCIFCYPAD